MGVYESWNDFWKDGAKAGADEKGLQHWVAQSILKRFAVENNRKRIACHHRSATTGSRVKNIRAVASHRRFYSPGLVTQDTNPDSLEDVFGSKVESQAGRGFGALRDFPDTQSLSAESRAQVARYIGAQMVRTPRAYEAVGAAWESGAALDSKSHDEVVQLVREAFGQGSDSSYISEADALECAKRVISGEITLPVPNRVWLDRILFWTIEMADRLEGMDWLVCQAPEGEVFVISDHPVVVIDPDRGPGVTLHSFPNPVVVFPFDKSLALVAKGRGGRTSLIKVAGEKYEVINKAVVYFADEEVYSSDFTNETWLRPLLDRGCIFDGDSEELAEKLGELERLQAVGTDIDD